MFKYVQPDWRKTIEAYKIWKGTREYYGFFSLNQDRRWQWTARDCKSLDQEELTKILRKLKELNGCAKNQCW